MKYDELEKLVENITISEQKTRSKINFGNVAEGILGAAMARRFVEGDQDVNAQEVYKTINDLESAEKTSFGKRSRYVLEYEVDRDPGIIGCPRSSKVSKNVPDILKLIVGLDQRDLDALFTGARGKLSTTPAKPGTLSDQAQFDGLLNASVAHANSEMPKFAKKWECNETEDEIHIVADGVGDQSGTKTDIAVLYRDKKGNMVSIPESTFGKISLKAGSAQMGQAGSLFSGNDKDGDGIKELMGRIFSVDLKNPDSLGYDKVYKAFQNAPAGDQEARDRLGLMLEKVYLDAYKQIEKIFKGGDPDEDARWISNLAQGVQNAAALGEKGVYLVNLDRAKGLASQINFDDVEEVFRKTGADMQVVYDGYYSATGGDKVRWPNIQVYWCAQGSECEGKDYLQLVKTRAKVEDRQDSKGVKKKRLAHYIEMGTGLKQLIKLAREMNETKDLTNNELSYKMLYEMVENLMSEE